MPLIPVLHKSQGDGLIDSPVVRTQCLTARAADLTPGKGIKITQAMKESTQIVK